MRMSRRAVALVTALAMLTTSGVTQAAASPVREHGVQQIAPGPLPQETFNALVEVHSVVAALPGHFDAMGDEVGAAQWLTGEFERRGWVGGCQECVRDVWSCLRSTAIAIISNVPVLTVFRLLGRVGGALKLIEGLNDAFTRSHQQQRDVQETLFEVFGALGEFVLEALSLDGVIDNCF